MSDFAELILFQTWDTKLQGALSIDQEAALLRCTVIPLSEKKVRPSALLGIRGLPD